MTQCTHSTHSVRSKNKYLKKKYFFFLNHQKKPKLPNNIYIKHHQIREYGTKKFWNLTVLDLTDFRHTLKTYLFHQSFPDILLYLFTYWLRFRAPCNDTCYFSHVKQFWSDWMIKLSPDEEALFNFEVLPDNCNCFKKHILHKVFLQYCLVKASL